MSSHVVWCVYCHCMHDGGRKGGREGGRKGDYLMPAVHDIKGAEAV